MSYITREIPEGAIRFNTDSSKMEVWVGDKWMQVSVTHEASPLGGRGLFCGGYTYAPLATAGNSNVIEFITISTQGNAVDFGDGTQRERDRRNGAASHTRGVLVGGTQGHPSPSLTDRIEFVTFATTGNATDFGNLLEACRGPGATSNATRGIVGGGSGSPARLDRIQFITIPSTGDSVDFGNLSRIVTSVGTVNSPTRAVFVGGMTANASGFENIMEYVTIATTGNAIDFGDTITAAGQIAGVSNGVRGVLAGGYSQAPAPYSNNTISYIIVASKGDAQEFGDLTRDTYNLAGVCDSTRGVFGGGQPGLRITMESIEIATKGNGIEFGDLAQNHEQAGSVSNAHGGL